MKKTLLLLCALLTLGVSGAWATAVTTYSVTNRASSIQTGKKYMIYNTARRYFLSASDNGYAITGSTTPLTYSTTSASYVWELESGDATGTFHIKNVGTSTYCAGGTALSSTATDYTVAEFSTCPAKGGMASYNDDGTTTDATSITSANNTVYIVAINTTAYWNGSDTEFNTYTAAHVYVLYEVSETTTSVISDLNDLRNAKCYTLSAPAGTLGVNGDNLVATSKAGFSASPFAILNYGGNYYLYSTSAEKFVNGKTDLEAVPSTPVTLEAIGETGTFKFKFGDNYININNGYDLGLIINWWSTTDNGNTFTINEAEEFDNTKAIAALKWYIDNTMTYTPTLGSWSGNNTNYSYQWTSTFTEPQLTFKTSDNSNNFNKADGGMYSINNGTTTYVLSVPAGYKITGYSFTATPSTGAAGMSITPDGESAINIAANGSEVSVTGLETTTASFVVNGRYVQVSNFAITYTIDPFTFITDLNDLNNGKAYIINTTRGSWQFADAATSMTASTGNISTSGANLQIAIVKQEDAYYLYSVNLGKYLTAANTLYTSPLDPVTITESSAANGNYKWFFSFDSSHNINMNTEPRILIDAWGTKDEGNTCAIIEAVDFDKTTALAAFTDYDQRITDYCNYHTEVGQNFAQSYYDKVGYPSQSSTGYTELADIMLKQSGATADDYTNLPTKYAAYLAETNIKTPPAGFYRIYHTVTADGTKKYLSDTGSALVATTSVDDAKKSLFYWDGSTLVAYNGGFYINQVSRSLTAATFTFTKSNQGTFGQMNVNPSSGSPWYVEDATGEYTLNRWSGGSQVGSNFQVEAVTSLPVTISAAKYATLYAPVALTIPTGVTAYTAVDDGNYLTLTAIEDNVIPANTGVILAGEANTYNFTVTTGGSVSSKALTGTVAAIARPKGSYILATGGSGVGFYADGASTIPGFKAYLPSGSGSVKSFRFADADAIRNISSALNKSEVYDLQGRRVAQPAHGLYIVNGKKVVIK